MAPLFMHAGMVVADVVEGDHDAAAGMTTGLTQFLEEAKKVSPLNGSSWR